MGASRFTLSNLAFCFLLLSLQWVSFSIHAQTYSYRHYTVEDGLPTNYVYGGLQDSEGYIWFFTEKGVSRFDGYEFRNFTTEDGLPANDVWQLEEDSQGRMWVGCFGDRLVAIDKDTVVTIYGHSEKSRRFLGLIKVGEKLWTYIQYPNTSIVDYNQKIDTLHGNGFSNAFRQRAQSMGYEQQSYLLGHKQYAFFRADPPRVILLRGNDSKVDTLRINGLDKRLANSLLSSTQTSYFARERSLYILPRTDSFIYHLDLDRKYVERQNIYGALGGKLDYKHFQYHDDEHFLFQTDRGVVKYQAPFTAVDTLVVELPEHPSLGQIFSDRENNYWVPTRGQGVYLLPAQARRTKVFTATDKGETAAFCELAFSPDGQLYAGTQKGAVYRLEGGQLNPIVPRPDLSMNDLRRVRKIIFDKDGGWWMARQGRSLLYFPPGSEEGVPFKNLTAGAEVIELEEPDSRTYSSGFRKTLFFNTELYIKDLAWHEPTQRLFAARRAFSFVYQGNTRPKPRLTVVSSIRNHAAFYSSDGSLWMGLKQGLATYREGVYEDVETNTLIDERAVFCFEEDERERLWLGTDGAGVFLRKKEKFIRIAGTEGLIVQDLRIRSGVVWVATNKGVYKININPGSGTGIVEEVFSTNYGLPSPEIMAVEVDENYVYAATSEGLARIAISQSEQEGNEVLFNIDQVKINGAQVALDSVYQLNYKQNEIEVNFTALSYKSYGNITYFYQLENADREPLSTKNRRLRYGGLKPGKYKLRIFAQDIEGEQSQVRLIRFNIAPPWWQTPMAMLSSLCLLAFLGWLAYRRRIYQIQQQAAAETELNKQFAELELKALQAQMNPHFVFNSLSAIQYYIQTNEKEQAEGYLAKFATLMRLFLESSKNKYLNLNEELRLIQLYVELEQLRFRGKFDFKLKIDPEINTYATLVPTMLLQPFVENAINHGLFHKKEKGQLRLSIDQAEGVGLRCLLEDDGVGRQRAMAIRKESQKNYRSRALQITDERLNALSTVEGYNIDIEITDLFDPDGQAAGTRVEIIIPTIE